MKQLTRSVDRIQEIGDVGMAAQNHARCPRLQEPSPLEHIGSARTGHALISDNQIERCLFDQGERLGRGGHAGHSELRTQ